LAGACAATLTKKERPVNKCTYCGRENEIAAQCCTECGTPFNDPTPQSSGSRWSRFSYEAQQKEKREVMTSALQTAKIRRCACGATLSPTAIRQYFVSQTVPCGHKLTYSCPACGRKMAIPSLAAMFWSALGAVIGGGAFAGMVTLWFEVKPRDLVGWLPWILAGCTLAVGSLFFFSAYTLTTGTRNRFTYPKVK
jgi:hypothetical protein